MFEQDAQTLLAKPVGNLRAYLRRGFDFFRYEPDGNTAFRGNVVLIHGLLMRAGSMSGFAARFMKRGYRCFSYDYPTSRLGIFRHGEILRERLSALFAQIPAEEKICVVTHSMGGILLRIALETVPSEMLARIDCVVMLAPPNQGSYWPERIRKIFPPVKLFCRCLPDLRHTEDSPLRKIKLPQAGAFPRLRIVEATYDAKVKPEQLPLPGVPAKIVSAPCGHAALRHSQEAFDEALRFIEA